MLRQSLSFLRHPDTSMGLQDRGLVWKRGSNFLRTILFPLGRGRHKADSLPNLPYNWVSSCWFLRGLAVQSQYSQMLVKSTVAGWESGEQDSGPSSAV